MKPKKLKNINLFWAGIFTLIFLGIYFFIVTSFFQGWENAKYFDDVPDLLIAFVSFLFIAYSFRLKKKKSKKFIFYGGLFMGLGRLIEIPMQEYQFMTFSWLPIISWVPVQSLIFIGIFLILSGFKEEVK